MRLITKGQNIRSEDNMVFQQSLSCTTVEADLPIHHTVETIQPRKTYIPNPRNSSQHPTQSRQPQPQLSTLLLTNIRDLLMMPPRCNQHMSRTQRHYIEERHAQRRTENHKSGRRYALVIVQITIRWRSRGAWVRGGISLCDVAERT